jgi:hypothetical protein
VNQPNFPEVSCDGSQPREADRFGDDEEGKCDQVAGMGRDVEEHRLARIRPERETFNGGEQYQGNPRDEPDEQRPASNAQRIALD